MASITAFPAFRRLDGDDRCVIEEMTRRLPPYSDFSFTSLWSWDTDGSCAISLLHGNLVVRLKAYDGNEHHLSFFGTNAVTETALTLLDHARATGHAPQLRLVPEATIAADDRLRGSLSVAADHANFDYVYRLADWVSLAGEPFRKHRRAVVRCRAAAAPAFVPLDLTDPAVRQAIADLAERWSSQKTAQAAADAQPERAALDRLLGQPGGGRLRASGLFDRDRLIGFSIWEGVPGGSYAISHFRKTDRAYEGVGALLRHEESQFLVGAGFRYMNVEQDLGLAGLRRYKSSLRPCHFLRKYVIEGPSVART